VALLGGRAVLVRTRAVGVDDGRWGALNGYQPQDGETVGIWVGAGNLRGQSYTGATCPRVCERSNVQMVQWHNDDQALYTFSLPNGKTLGLRRPR
jgi:hypothetical protein